MPENTHAALKHSSNEQQIFELLLEIKDELAEIRTELTSFKKEVNSAFIKDEEGNIDYHGHRLFHRKEKESEKVGKEFQVGFAKKAFEWAGIAALGFVATSVWAYFKGLL
jgi:hypothetical protein